MTFSLRVSVYMFSRRYVTDDNIVKAQAADDDDDIVAGPQKMSLRDSVRTHVLCSGLMIDKVIAAHYGTGGHACAFEDMRTSLLFRRHHMVHDDGDHDDLAMSNM
jgi:hypothetical protein